MNGVDRHVERWVVHHRVGWLNAFFEALSYVGTLGAIWIAIAVALALLWRRWGIVVFTVAAVAIADLSARGLKDVFQVARPSTRYAEPKPLIHAPHDASFPSGHAATSFAAATLLTTFAPRWAPAWFALACAIAFSRVYVGVHYPLDVIGGAVLGAVIAITLRLAYTRRTKGAAWKETLADRAAK